MKQIIKTYWKEAAICILLAAFLVTGIQLSNTKGKLEKATKDIEQKQDRIDVLDSSLEGSRLLVQECQNDLETAWKAFKRRNDMFVEVLDNPLDPAHELTIQLDNSAANREVDAASDCNPLIDSKIFGD
jgi:multidrug resistance efflux pump